MKKSRFEAFTDAIVAIIVTIMVLELKTPSSPNFSALFDTAPYFLAYIASFIFIGTAWYNHHYMISIVNHISKKIYWLNNLWLFSMSLLPLATGWVGKFIDYRDPEIFYLLVFSFWGFTFRILSTAIANQLEAENNHPERIKNMPIYKRLVSLPYWITIFIVLILSLVFPPIVILSTLSFVTINGFKTNKDSDKVD